MSRRTHQKHDTARLSIYNRHTITLCLVCSGLPAPHDMHWTMQLRSTNCAISPCRVSPASAPAGTSHCVLRPTWPPAGADATPGPLGCLLTAPGQLSPPGRPSYAARKTAAGACAEGCRRSDRTPHSGYAASPRYPPPGQDAAPHDRPPPALPPPPPTTPPPAAKQPMGGKGATSTSRTWRPAPP